MVGIYNNYGWLIIIVMILIFLVLIVIVVNTKPGSQFGTYGPVIPGPCITANGLCTQPGTRTNIQNCIINDVTGKGCINSEGLQSFDSIITTEACSLVCQSSIWQDVTPPSALTCVPPPDPDNTNINPAPTGQCIPRIYNGKPLLGSRTLTYQCVGLDATGPNNCTAAALQSIVGPTGVTGTIPLLQTYNVGDQVKVQENCDVENTNPFCGYWGLYDDPSYVDNTALNTNLINLCTWNPTYVLSDSCNVGTNSGTPFGLFNEGFLLQPMACIKENNTAQIPPIFDPTELHTCLQNPSNINCDTLAFSNTDFLNNTLNPGIEANPFICANQYNSSSSAQNPTCLQPCRLYPSPINNIASAPNFNPLVNNSFIIFNGNDYISGIQLPRNDNMSQTVFLNIYEPQNIFPTSGQQLFNTNLIATPLGYVVNGSRMCTNQQLAFATAIFFNVSFVSIINASQAVVKLYLNIPPGFNGWLNGQSGNPVTWSQATAMYDSFGLNSVNVANFILTIITPLNGGPVAGYPNSLGSMTVSLTYADTNPIPGINDVNGNLIPSFFFNMTLIVFENLNLDYSSRGNLTSTSCNLYITT